MKNLIARSFTIVGLLGLMSAGDVLANSSVSTVKSSMREFVEDVRDRLLPGRLAIQAMTTAVDENSNILGGLTTEQKQKALSSLSRQAEEVVKFRKMMARHTPFNIIQQEQELERYRQARDAQKDSAIKLIVSIRQDHVDRTRRGQVNINAPGRVSLTSRELNSAFNDFADYWQLVDNLTGRHL